ncbi:MAG: hypothetical protein QXP36_04875 [Conexivisphaerales archaeon]
MVNEVLEKVKRRMFFELKEEPLKIVFRNCALGWRAFLEGDFERALIPIEETPIFPYIPFNLNVELLKKALKNLA